MPSYISFRGLFYRPWYSFFILLVFFVNTIGPLPQAQADESCLPAPGMMVSLSPEFKPPVLTGIKIHPENPFRFDFILDKGDAGTKNIISLRSESTNLIKYFLASLTIPEQDLWVNLSPYEKDRIIPQSFGQTEMGRDLLVEDYMLKQITASLIYPEGAIGKKFWKRIYEEAAKKFGTTNIPVNTFNKVWIIPEKAVVYENIKAGTAYVVEAKLKVMLEQDYLSMSKHMVVHNDMASVGANIVREIVIPELTREVNEDKSFAQLRQIYNSLILATWYKKKIKDSILEQVYADKNKVAGVEYDKSVILSAANDLKKSLDPSPSAQNDAAFIYQRYLQAFKKGVYNFIKEENDPLTQQIVPRKYFSGGVPLFEIEKVERSVEKFPNRAMLNSGSAELVQVRLDQVQNHETASTVSLQNMLKVQNNPEEMTRRFIDIMDPLKRKARGINKVIVSVGSGNGEFEVKLAQIPGVAVIALDVFEDHENSYYEQFKANDLESQKAAVHFENLVCLRIDFFKLLQNIPAGVIDDLILINPDDMVYKELYGGLNNTKDQERDILRVLSGQGKVYIKPYLNFKELSLETLSFYIEHFVPFGDSIHGVKINDFTDFPTNSKVLVFDPRQNGNARSHSLEEIFPKEVLTDISGYMTTPGQIKKKILGDQLWIYLKGLVSSLRGELDSWINEFEENPVGGDHGSGISIEDPDIYTPHFQIIYRGVPIVEIKLFINKQEDWGKMDFLYINPVLRGAQFESKFVLRALDYFESLRKTKIRVDLSDDLTGYWRDKIGLEKTPDDLYSISYVRGKITDYLDRAMAVRAVSRRWVLRAGTLGAVLGAIQPKSLLPQGQPSQESRIFSPDIPAIASKSPQYPIQNHIEIFGAPNYGRGTTSFEFSMDEFMASSLNPDDLLDDVVNTLKESVKNDPETASTVIEELNEIMQEEGKSTVDKLNQIMREIDVVKYLPIITPEIKELIKQQLNGAPTNFEPKRLSLEENFPLKTPKNRSFIARITQFINNMENAKHEGVNPWEILRDFRNYLAVYLHDPLFLKEMEELKSSRNDLLNYLKEPGDKQGKRLKVHFIGVKLTKERIDTDRQNIKYIVDAFKNYGIEIGKDKLSDIILHEYGPLFSLEHNHELGGIQLLSVDINHDSDYWTRRESLGTAFNRNFQLMLQDVPVELKPEFENVEYVKIVKSLYKIGKSIFVDIPVEVESRYKIKKDKLLAVLKSYVDFNEVDIGERDQRIIENIENEENKEIYKHAGVVVIYVTDSHSLNLETTLKEKGRSFHSNLTPAIIIDLRASNNNINGGIDLTPAHMNVQAQVENDSGMLTQNGIGIKFHIDPAMLQQLQDASGFFPVIISIKPLGNLPQFLGIN